MQRETNMNTVQSIAMLLLLALPGCNPSQDDPKGPPILGKTKTQNVLLVTTDGMRWQEIFPSARQLVRDNRWDARYRRSVFRRDSAPG